MEEIAEDRNGIRYSKPQSQMLGESMLEQMFKACGMDVKFVDCTPKEKQARDIGDKNG
jgi:hypothetical protein